MYQKVGLRRPELYGIAGRKQHGKDTFAKAVSSAALALHNPSSFETTHFADPLKQMAMAIFNLSEEQLYDDVLKDAPLPSPIVMDLFVGAMSLATSLTIKPAGLVARTSREVAQFFGTEYVRAAQDDYWVQKTLDGVRSQVPDRRRRVLIPDTRFPNEAEALRSVGGKIIKIVRIDAPPRPNEHKSELAVDLIEPDLLLVVRTGNLDLVERAAKLIACNKFDRAQSFDYRRAKPALEAYAGGMPAEEAAKLIGHKHTATLYFLLEYYGGHVSFSRVPQTGAA